LTLLKSKIRALYTVITIDNEPELKKSLNKLNKFSANLLDKEIVRAKNIVPVSDPNLEQFSVLSKNSLHLLIELYAKLIEHQKLIKNAQGCMDRAITDITPEYEDLVKAEKNTRKEYKEIQKRIDRSWPPCLLQITGIEQEWKNLSEERDELIKEELHVRELIKRYKKLIADYMTLTDQIVTKLTTDTINKKTINKRIEIQKGKYQDQDGAQYYYDQIIEGIKRTYREEKKDRTKYTEAVVNAILALNNILHHPLQYQVNLDNSVTIDNSVNVEGNVIDSVVAHSTGDVSISNFKGVIVDISKHLKANSTYSYTTKKGIENELQELQNEIQTTKSPEDRGSFTERRFENLQKMAPDIMDVIVSFLEKGPPGVIYEVFKKIALKVRDNAKK
jgi:hypothetical protein